jgi:hypothetical protein
MVPVVIARLDLEEEIFCEELKVFEGFARGCAHGASQQTHGAT